MAPVSGLSFNNTPPRLQLFNENDTAGQSKSQMDVEDTPMEQNNRVSAPRRRICHEESSTSCCSSLVDVFGVGVKLVQREKMFQYQQSDNCNSDCGGILISCRRLQTRQDGRDNGHEDAGGGGRRMKGGSKAESSLAGHAGEEEKMSECRWV